MTGKRQFLAEIDAAWLAVKAFTRNLPLFISPRPGTSLRVLCIMAFDLLHRMRFGKPLPAGRIQKLAALLDLGACVNAAFDRKRYGKDEFRLARQELEADGMTSAVREYLRCLWRLESSRPYPGGRCWSCQSIQVYREQVVCLSLAAVASVAGIAAGLDDGMAAIGSDSNLNCLFRVVMQCQIIDDALDYAKDAADGLPSFLTAGRSPKESRAYAQWTSRVYADEAGWPKGQPFVLRVAMSMVSQVAALTLLTVPRTAAPDTAHSASP